MESDLGYMYRRTQKMVEDLSQIKGGSKPLHFETKYSKSTWAQFLLLLKKFNIIWWRTPEYNATRIFFTIVFALVVSRWAHLVCNTTSTSDYFYHVEKGYTLHWNWLTSLIFWENFNTIYIGVENRTRKLHLAQALPPKKYLDKAAVYTKSEDLIMRIAVSSSCVVWLDLFEPEPHLLLNWSSCCCSIYWHLGNKRTEVNTLVRIVPPNLMIWLFMTRTKWHLNWYISANYRWIFCGRLKEHECKNGCWAHFACCMVNALLKQTRSCMLILQMDAWYNIQWCSMHIWHNCDREKCICMQEEQRTIMTQYEDILAG